MELLPAIDLRQGGVVRLRQGRDDERTEYEVEPAEALRRWAELGVERVHVVDLDAAFGEEPQRGLIEALVREGVARLQLGGGLRDREAVEWALDLGCDRVVLTSLLARDFDLFAELCDRFPGRLVPALDVQGDRVRTHGWRGEAEGTVDELAARLRGLPIGPVLVTDIERDGTLEGPNVELTRRVARSAGVGGLVSGGVSRLEDLEQARRFEEIEGVIVGRAFYDGRIDAEAAAQLCRAGGEETG
jgi:phosphoribosylformimino-5-aminoimidazole carboxamide ribotide isomerase